MTISFLYGSLAVFALDANAVSNNYENRAPDACATGFEYNKAIGKCVEAAISRLGSAACSAANHTFVAAAGTTPSFCHNSAKDKAPSCAEVNHHTSKVEVIDGEPRCKYTAAITPSSSGDYISDYFVIATPITVEDQPGVVLLPNETYMVTDQGPNNDNDRQLTLVRGGGDFFWYAGRFNAAPNAKPVMVNASDLHASGAGRRGWVWGLLTTPYKYYFEEKEFDDSATIGPYLGYRFSRAGAGVTFALAATLGAVKADTFETVNGVRRRSGDTNIAALSFAGGVIFDFLKSKQGRPFTVGLLLGTDIANTDPQVEFEHNKELWVALNIGYQFTDNTD